MKVSNFLLVLMFVSVFLFIPVVKPPVETDIFISEDTTIIVNIQSPRIYLRTNIASPLNTTISLMDPATDELEKVFEGSIFVENELELFSRGNYLFVFESRELGSVSIDERGIDGVSILIFISTTLIAIGYNLYDRFRVSIEY